MNLKEIKDSIQGALWVNTDPDKQDLVKEWIDNEDKQKALVFDYVSYTEFVKLEHPDINVFSIHEFVDSCLEDELNQRQMFKDMGL